MKNASLCSGNEECLPDGNSSFFIPPFFIKKAATFTGSGFSFKTKLFYKNTYKMDKYSLLQVKLRPSQVAVPLSLIKTQIK